MLFTSSQVQESETGRLPQDNNVFIGRHNVTLLQNRSDRLLVPIDDKCSPWLTTKLSTLSTKQVPQTCWSPSSMLFFLTLRCEELCISLKNLPTAMATCLTGTNDMSSTKSDRGIAVEI